ncbi:hypothetical protein [Ralstonia sp.]|uniref:hypothetical protein n=1 Tax=Ralstonia sp. TaxID=54061 RepID=UPI0031E06F9C
MRYLALGDRCSQPYTVRAGALTGGHIEKLGAFSGHKQGGILGAAAVRIAKPGFPAKPCAIRLALIIAKSATSISVIVIEAVFSAKITRKRRGAAFPARLGFPNKDPHALGMLCPIRGRAAHAVAPAT